MIDFNDKGNIAGWIVLIFIILPVSIAILILLYIKAKEYFLEAKKLFKR